MDISQIHGAIFDMDGTLVYSLHLWRDIWKRIGEVCGIDNFSPSSEDDKTVRTLVLVDAVAYVHDHYHLSQETEVLVKVAKGMLDRYYQNDVTAKEGVVPFLEALKKRGIPMYIASASPAEHVFIALDTCGLKHYFDGVVSCCDVGKGKEEPDVFIKTMEYMGSDREHTYVFEDSVTAVKTASAAGLKTVGIYDEYNYG